MQHRRRFLADPFGCIWSTSGLFPMYGNFSRRGSLVFVPVSTLLDLSHDLDIDPDLTN